MSPSTILIIVVVSIIFIFALSGFILWFFLRHGLQNRRLLRNGLPEEGKIISITESGVYINNKPQAIIEVEVQSRRFGVYQARTRQVISLFQIPQYQPNAKVSLRVDPQDPQKIAIERVHP